MCNEAARRRALNLIREDFSQLKIRLIFPEGAPNLAPLDSIRITDPTLIVRLGPAGRSSSGETEAEAIQRRWSWPGPRGQPVYNYRSEGREFRNGETGGRCLIPLDGFYEFTAPVVARGEPIPKRKDKWLFTQPDGAGEDALFCVAGLWRAGVASAHGGSGEAFTMLTCEPGPDVAPYHARQIVLMPRAHWADWLAGEIPAPDLIAPTPAGALRVARVR
ncbi:MAG: SOS response-associated peptidase family protein [Sphingomonadaceae bacterium]|nr:SOS response-associated peptidase family protein [Sphingomonadaceae bacterium]